MQAADDALVAILRKLHTFRGDSRLTTWAYKFALLEAGVKVRRRAWQGREVPLEEDGWARLPDRRASPGADVDAAELLGAVRDAIAECSLRTRGKCSSPSPSTTCRSTSSPNDWAPRAARSTRPSTTPAAS